jgi:hypothetical protein
MLQAKNYVINKVEYIIIKFLSFQTYEITRHLNYVLLKHFMINIVFE